MLLQTAISSPLHPHGLQPPPLSSTYFYSQTRLGFHLPLLIRTNRTRNISISCRYYQQVRRQGNLGDKWTVVKKWKEIYRRINLMEDPSLGAAAALDQWDREGRHVTKWELYRCVKELRKFRKYNLALQVYEWMNSQGDRFGIYSGDAAMELDLISKVHGISSAEEYFLDLPRSSKDKRTYGALLNAYVVANLREKAETLFENMRERSYTGNALSFNAMLTLYMNQREYEKVITLITEMLEKKVQLNFWSYNIWLTALGTLGSTEKMEQVVERMKLDKTIELSWAVYSTLASIYIKLGQSEKAKECLKMVEYKIRTYDRLPYHYLLSLYTLLGEKEDVYRIWNVYKSHFPNILNLGYKAMIASLLKFDDVEGAEKIYKEWLSVRTSYDPKICKLFIRWFVKKGLLEQAEDFLDQVLEVVRGKVNADTWMLLAEAYIEKKQILGALSCMKEATVAERADSWRPNRRIVSAFISVCEQESNLESKNELLEVFRKVGWSEDEKPRSVASTTTGVGIDFGSKLSMDRDISDEDSDDGNDDDEDSDDGNDDDDDDDDDDDENRAFFQVLDELQESFS